MTGVLGIIGTLAGVSFQAGVTDTKPSGSAQSSTIATSQTTATPINGVGPYTYSWSRTSLVGASNCTVSSATSATVSFTFTGVAPESTGTANWSCLVTDTATGRTATAFCTAEATNTTILG